MMISAFRLHLIRPAHSLPISYKFVGPSNSVSNLRPVLSTPLRNHHPYSLEEFQGDARDANLHLKLQKQQLDSFNHDFWVDVCLPYFDIRKNEV
jgi:hypothetical protein